MMYGIIKAYNNFNFFIYLLVIFVYIGLYVWLFFTIIDITERERESIFGRRNCIRKFIEQKIIDLNNKEENGIKRLKKIIPWIVGINTLFYFIILIIILPIYDFDIAYLMFITYGLTIAAFVDIYCLDIYKILTNGLSKPTNNG